MPNKIEYLQGKAKWFRHIQPNMYDKWSHDLYLTNEGVEKVRELQTSSKDTTGKTVSGIKNTLKKDDDGYYITISRPINKKIRGEIRAFTPPMVVDVNGAPFQGSVGNGSDVTTKIEIYTHRTPGSDGRAKAIRWVSTRIDNLVPFEADTGFREYEAPVVEGLSEQPKQLF